MFPLSGYGVVELASSIAGSYVGKMLVDAGAAVTKVEQAGGDPLRRQTFGGARVDAGATGALFQFLAASKSSLELASPSSRAELEHQLAEAHLAIWSADNPGGDGFAPHELRRRHPRLVVLSLTDFGLTSSWADRPANEFTRQAWSGGILDRGQPDREPICVGGGIGDYVSGAAATAITLTALRRAAATGVGDLIDFSLLEAHVLFNRVAPATVLSISGRPQATPRRGNVPDIERTKDGWVGFCLVRGQQWLDFCAMIGRVDWAEDEGLLLLSQRWERQAELLPAIAAWMGEHTTDEIVELASLFRIPVSYIGNPETIPRFAQFDNDRYFEKNATGLLQPAVPYRLGGAASTRPIGPAPALGEHFPVATDAPAAPLPAAADQADASRPLAGLRVVDLSHFWAGPIVGCYLGGMGADVIKVESVQRPDGLRFNTPGKLDEDRWWDRSPLFHPPNLNKRAITLNLEDPKGIELLEQLIAEADVLLENFTPRVLAQWGLTFDRLKQANPALIMVRIPAYGLEGPWADRPGYGPTMEQLAGIAHVTGYRDGRPYVPNGMMDPIAGFHALVALQVALAHRDRTGEGVEVEVPMVSAAFNVLGRQFVEYSAYGGSVGRLGNRSPDAAPQGVYRTGDVFEAWVAISVETDSQWRALLAALGHPSWGARADLEFFEGRARAHDEIDEHLAAWCADRTAHDVVEVLWPAGVPVAHVMDPFDHQLLEPLRTRGYFAEVEHPLTGTNVHGRFPALLEQGPATWTVRRVPMLGEHNREVLSGLLGLTSDEIAALEAGRVIGDTPVGI